MSMLGLQGDRAYVPVTSMCFNQQGDLIFAGYGDGHCSVWDVQKASALKVISEHKAPAVHMLYLGQDAQVTRQFSIITGDSKGVVKLVQFSVVPWVNRISYSKAMVSLHLQCAVRSMMDHITLVHSLDRDFDRDRDYDKDQDYDRDRDYKRDRGRGRDRDRERDRDHHRLREDKEVVIAKSSGY